MKGAYIIAAVILAAALTSGCSREEKVAQPDYARALGALMSTDSVTAWNVPRPMADRTVRMRVRYMGPEREVFNDSNHIHWQAAESIGIRPLGSLASHWQLNRPLVKITSCPDFFVEPLTHSVPYLVPEAAAALHEIGRRFTDSVAARGGSRYRVRVTSVTRTPQNVRRLRRGNVNAIDSSVHQLGTTVDISYARFIPDPGNPVDRSVDDLKGVLAEVLAAMRSEGKIYVKHERRQPCFHITARPRPRQP